jgi:hypothetical protein
MQLRIDGNWLHIIFRQIVLEAAQIWREPQQKNWLLYCTLSTYLIPKTISPQNQKN